MIDVNHQFSLSIFYHFVDKKCMQKFVIHAVRPLCKILRFIIKLYNHCKYEVSNQLALYICKDRRPIVFFLTVP